MIRVVLIAGAAAASVGVKRLQGRRKNKQTASLGDASKKGDTLEDKEEIPEKAQDDLGLIEQKPADIDAESEELSLGVSLQDAGESSVTAETLNRGLSFVAENVNRSEANQKVILEQPRKEEENDSPKKELAELAASISEQAVTNTSESPKRARISDATISAGDGATPLVTANPPINPPFDPLTNIRQNLSVPSPESPKIRRARVGNLRLEIEGASQGDAFSPSSPAAENSAEIIHVGGIHIDAGGAGIKAPLTPTANASTVRTNAVLAFPTPSENHATPNLSGANTPTNVSIHAPPSDPTKPQSPPPPLLAVRAIPTVPSRSRSRGPRISVIAGLLDILPEGGERLWAARALDQPPIRNSFTDGVFGALARSIPKVILPFPSKSVPSSPVGSIRAPPTPGGTSKPPNPQGRSPSTPVIRAVPTGGSAQVVFGFRGGRARSADAFSDRGTSAGTKAETESVVVSSIETESQRRVARERLSLKDRWERDEKAAETRVAEHSADANSDALSDVEGPDTRPSDGRRRPAGPSRDDIDGNETGTEPKMNGNGPMLDGFGRSPSGTGRVLEKTDGKATSGLGWDLAEREKALRELESEEQKRWEGLRVLEEREAELKKRLEELEGVMAGRRAADVAGGPGHVNKSAFRMELGAEDKFDEANFECWCRLRAGPSDATAHWYSSGEVFSYPGGQLVARLEGFEAVRARRRNARLVDELSRRLLLFVDKETGKPLSDAPGGIRTAYQHCTYRLEGSVVHTEVVIGSGENTARLGGTAGGVRVMRGAQGAVFTRPTFLSLPSENGNFLAFENHDFFTIPVVPGSDPTDHFSMVRLGPVPGFPGQCFIHVVGWKTADLSVLPAVLRDELDKEPLWKEAPEKVYH